MPYNFLKDARSIDNSRLCFYDRVDGYSSDFSVNGNVDGWDAHSGVYLYGCWQGILFGTSFQSSCYFSRSNPFLVVPAETYYYVQIMMKLTNNHPYKTAQGLTTGRVMWTRLDDNTWTSDKQLDFTIYPDDKWHLYNINMGPAQWWQGDINNLRIYPFIDGWDGDQFAIKYIKISSLNGYVCTNTQCSYYTQYSHPCGGAGIRGGLVAGTTKTSYTTISGISDELILNIDSYGYEHFKLGTNENVSGIEMAKILANKISSLNIGGYSYVTCTHTAGLCMQIESGTVGSDSSVILAYSKAAEELGFFNSVGTDVSSSRTGSAPATGFDYASSRMLTALEINKLIDGVYDSFAYIHNPDQYNVEGGRRDFNEIGTGMLLSNTTGTDYYESLNNSGKTIIDMSHPFNNNGRIRAIYICGSGSGKVKILRPFGDGSLRVVQSLNLPTQSASYIYTSYQSVYRIDCDFLVNKGDLIGIYNADVYVGRSISGLPDATFCVFNGEATGTIDPGSPYSFGIAGLAIYARGNRFQTNVTLDVDLGTRINLEEVDIYGQEESNYFEFNIAACLDVDWAVDLHGETHVHYGINWANGEPFSHTHTNIYYGLECLNDCIRTADNGQLGTGYGKDGNGLYTTGSNHSYFYVNGDAEWLYAYTNDGKHEYAWPYVPYGTSSYIFDPITFFLEFPYNKALSVHKSIMYFKERSNFRAFDLAYYLGDNATTGNILADTRFSYVPSYTKVALDGMDYYPDNDNWIDPYIFANPTTDEISYVSNKASNWQQFASAATTSWNILEHEFDPISCRGFRIHVTKHLSTKIAEMEVYSRTPAEPSLLDNVLLYFSDEGVLWRPVTFTEGEENQIIGFVGGAPQYLRISFDSSTSFQLNEVSASIGDEVKLGSCSDFILLEDAKSESINEPTSVEITNVYDKPFDLSVDVPVDTSETNNLVFWSKLHSEEDIISPDVGPSCVLRKSIDYDIVTANNQIAINLPSYALKNSIHNKNAYFGHNGVDYFDFGILSSGVSVDFCNTKYVNYKKTVLTFPAVSSKYWKIGFPGIAVDAYINDVLAYYGSTRSDVSSVFANSASGVSSQLSEHTSDGIYMCDPLITFSDDFEDGTYTPTWTMYPWNNTGTPVLTEGGGRLRITNYGTGSANPYGAYAEHVLSYPMGEFDISAEFKIYYSTNFLGPMAYFGIVLINYSGGSAIDVSMYDAWDWKAGYLALSDRTGTKYSGSYGNGMNTVRLVRQASVIYYYVGGNLVYSTSIVSDTIYKIRIYFGRIGSYTPYDELGIYNLTVNTSVTPNMGIDRCAGFSLSASDPLNSITLIHGNVTLDKAEVWTSPDNGNNYVRARDVSQVTLNPKNSSINSYFVVDLVNRHDLDIIRNYGNSTDKYLLSLNTADYSNSDVDNVELVTWANSTYNDVRWLRILLPNDTSTKCIRKLGVYPDIATIFCRDSGYNCEWEHIGTVLSDYPVQQNIAFNCTVTGTNNYFRTWYPTNAIDGVYTDYDSEACWGFETVSGVAPYLEMDFGDVHRINKIVIYHGHDPADSSYMNTSYTFSISPTVTGSFTTVVSVTGNSSFERTHIFDTVSAMRARLTVTGYNSGYATFYDADSGLYQRFSGSFVREIQVFTDVETGYIDSESWPIACMNLKDQFVVVAHDLINKNVLDTSTDWDNNEIFFSYSDSIFDDPKKVSFMAVGSGSIVTQYYKTESFSSTGGGKVEHVFTDSAYFDSGQYAVAWDAYDADTASEISIRLEGPHTIDDFADTLAGGTWASQTGLLNVPEAGYYAVKGVQHVDAGETWGIRNPVITRPVDFTRWVAVKRNTAENYSYDNDSGKYGKDYLSAIKIYSDTNTKCCITDYSWWWRSELSILTEDYLTVVSRPRSIRITYPVSSGTDIVSFIEGDDFGEDVDFAAKDYLSFWFFVSDINKLDTSFGNISFGDVYSTEAAYFTWNIENITLQTGWNNVRLKFEQADYTYPSLDASTSPFGFFDDRLNYRLNGKNFTSFVITYRGVGESFHMNLENIYIERNRFDDDVKFGKGLCLNGYDYLEIPVSNINLEKGAVEFWMKPYTDSYGRDIFSNMNSRVLFTLVNNNNDIVSLSIKSGTWLEPNVGHIRHNLNFFSIDSYDLPITNYIDRDEVLHVALVWSNDGRFMDNGDTIRLYINGILICASKVTWELGDTKSAVVKLGGATSQMAHNKDAYGSAIFENLKIYNFCKNEFNVVSEDIIKDITYFPNQFMEISSDNINFYGVGSSNLPIVFSQVPVGETKIVYIRASKNANFAQSKKTANLLIEWTTTV